MTVRPKIAQLLWLTAAAVLIAASGWLQGPLDRRAEQHEIAIPAVARNNPELALIQVFPGGLRAILITYYWITQEDLKQEGRFYDAMQRAEIICSLQPRFAGVWSFQSWNMAWNISVMTRTPEERWYWVSNGIRLLRDRGIPLNPKALELYKDLAWIFFFKIGQTTDEMHVEYKQRWAREMQHLLGAPPFGATEEVIRNFRPVAEAPLDRNPDRQGQANIQMDLLERLLVENPRAREYLGLLASRGVGDLPALLTSYNRFSRDDNAAIVRPFGFRPESEQDRAVSDLINRADYAAERDRLLALARAHLLWNVYKMDPAWMLALMQRYGPLDWRLPEPHGLYWITYGLHVVKGLTLEGAIAYETEPVKKGESEDIASLNVGRIMLNTLKYLTWNGRLTYLENPRKPEAPAIAWHSDWRFIRPTQDEHLRLINVVLKQRGGALKDNILRSGHINYLISAIQMLYAAYRRDEAREYFDWVKEKYDPDDPLWRLSLDQFVVEQINKEGSPIPWVARSQATSAIQVGLVRLAMNDPETFRQCLQYAQKVHDTHSAAASENNRLPPLEIMGRNVLADLLVEPRILGYKIDLLTRARLYAALSANWPRLQVLVYDLVAPYLQQQCQEEGLAWETLFPAPPGLEEYRAEQARILSEQEAARWQEQMEAP